MMSQYEVVRMPADQEALQEMLVEFAPFLDEMYTEGEEELFGELNFLLDHWLFLWDNGAGAFLVERKNNGKIRALAMLTQFRDIWHAKPRMEIQRISVADDVEDQKAVIDGMVSYLKSVAPLLRFDILYINWRGEGGNEYKELVWNKGK